MKTLSILLLLFLAAAPAFSKDIKFPEEGKTLFTITIPDSWEPEFDDEGTLEGEDKDGNAYIAIWEEDTETKLKDLAGDIDEILDEYAKDVKTAGKPEPIELAGIRGLIFKGTAKDKEDGTAVAFEAFYLVVNEESSVVFFYDYAVDAPESVAKRLVNILKSLKPTK